MTMYYNSGLLTPDLHICYPDLHICYKVFSMWAFEGRELPNYKMNNGREHFKWLLGREDEELFPTTEDIDLAKKLSGEHGWAIYKMLLARRLPENEF